MDVLKVDLTSLDRSQLLKVAFALTTRCDQLAKEVQRLVHKLERIPPVPAGNPNLQLPKEERPLANMGRPTVEAVDALPQEDTSHGSSDEDQEAQEEPKPSSYEHPNSRGAKHGQRGR